MSVSLLDPRIVKASRDNVDDAYVCAPDIEWEPITPMLPLDGQTFSLLLFLKNPAQTVPRSIARDLEFECWEKQAEVLYVLTRQIPFALTDAQTRTNCNKDTQE